VYAARIRELARKRDVTLEVNLCGIGGRVKTFDLVERYGLKTRFTLGSFLEDGRDRFLFPSLDRRLFGRNCFFDFRHNLLFESSLVYQPSRTTYPAYSSKLIDGSILVDRYVECQPSVTRAH
jgi:hypothetical protein